MGTPEFAVPMLDTLISSEHEVVGVITAPDKPAGRGMQLIESDVKKFAKEKELKVVESKTEEAVRFKDYSGVACPMNFVKTKMELSKLGSGDVLEILLDDGAPIDNVPKSVASEGHTVEATTKEGNGWRVRILKK